MEQLFIADITIEKVRHLENIRIPLSGEKRKHLILTGCNGSGKTSLLEVLAHYLNAMATSNDINHANKNMDMWEKALTELKRKGEKSGATIEAENGLKYWKEKREGLKGGLDIEFNSPAKDTIRYVFEKGWFVLGYYRDERTFHAEISKHVEKVELKDRYSMTDNIRQEFVKYLVDRQVTGALAGNKGNTEKAKAIKNWFRKLERLLGEIFRDPDLKLIFDEDTFNFTISQKGREPFDFNTVSSGFSAVLDIVLDLILRMEKATNSSFVFDVPGIVLIDEIEIHLHLEMQKNILRLLTTVFPNIQFIISTHSPFILNSLRDVVIYDLERQLLVQDGLENIPYSGIVEGYFHADEMSYKLEEKFKRYKELVGKAHLTEDQLEEIGDLELYLDEIPDYLALNITTEYQRLKLEYEKREDFHDKCYKGNFFPAGGRKRGGVREKHQG